MKPCLKNQGKCDNNKSTNIDIHKKTEIIKKEPRNNHMGILKLNSIITETKNLLEELNKRFKIGKNSELKDKPMEIIITAKHKKKLN